VPHGHQTTQRYSRDSSKNADMIKTVSIRPPLGPGSINTHCLSADTLHARIHSLTEVCLHCCNCVTSASFCIDVWPTFKKITVNVTLTNHCGQIGKDKNRTSGSLALVFTRTLLFYQSILLVCPSGSPAVTESRLCALKTDNPVEKRQTPGNRTTNNVSYDTIRM